MNLLIEDIPGYIEVGDLKIDIKTDFKLWVRFLIAVNSNDGDRLSGMVWEIFGEVPECNPKELMESIWKWLSPNGKKDASGKKVNGTAKTAFDFNIDGNVIFCELWEYFPHLMEKGISFHQGMELIKLLISNDRTIMYHRAYARCADLSGMSTKQKNYWLGERAKYAIKTSQEEFDAVFSEWS